MLVPMSWVRARNSSSYASKIDDMLLVYQGLRVAKTQRSVYTFGLGAYWRSPYS